jgi:hypothetical protein
MTVWTPSREEVWLRAWAAVASSFNAKSADCTRYADTCLKEFDERFPPRKPPEARFCGVPLSELTEERKAQFWRDVMNTPPPDNTDV